MSAPGEPAPTDARGGYYPLLPRWFSFGVLPFLLALTLTVAISAYRNHQQLAAHPTPSGLAPAAAAVHEASP